MPILGFRVKGFQIPISKFEKGFQSPISNFEKGFQSSIFYFFVQKLRNSFQNHVFSVKFRSKINFSSTENLFVLGSMRCGEENVRRAS